MVRCGFFEFWYVIGLLVGMGMGIHEYSHTWPRLRISCPSAVSHTFTVNRGSSKCREGLRGTKKHEIAWAGAMFELARCIDRRPHSLSRVWFDVIIHYSVLTSRISLLSMKLLWVFPDPRQIALKLLGHWLWHVLFSFPQGFQLQFHSSVGCFSGYSPIICRATLWLGDSLGPTPGRCRCLEGIWWAEQAVIPGQNSGGQMPPRYMRGFYLKAAQLVSTRDDFLSLGFLFIWLFGSSAATSRTTEEHRGLKCIWTGAASCRMRCPWRCPLMRPRRSSQRTLLFKRAATGLCIYGWLRDAKNSREIQVHRISL